MLAKFVLLLLAFASSNLVLAQDDDSADIPSQDLRVAKNEKQRYFLIGPRKDVVVPEDGYGLVVILPGGAGSAEFHPFVKRIYKNSVPEGFLAAQIVAVKWTETQEVVWPTKLLPVEKMAFTTEEFVAAVIQEVAAKHKVDPRKVFTLSWSSSGPAAYAIALTNKAVTGSLIAMSVYKPNLLSPLNAAKGKPFYLYHSPDDRVCPYRMAQQAARELSKHDARVQLTTYDGGHGWHGGFYDDLRTGFRWLEEHAINP